MSDLPTRVVVIQFPQWSAFAAACGRSERSAFETVVHAVVEHVPLVEVTAAGVIVFATRGPSRYVGGDDRLAALLRTVVDDAVNQMTVDDDASSTATYGIGIADGRLAAALAARQALQSGAPVVVPSGASGDRLADTPVRELMHCISVIGAPVVGALKTAETSIGVSHAKGDASYRDVVSLLERLGLYRFGDVAALSEPDLIARFGAFGRDLSRLARGLDRHPPVAAPPPPDRVCLVRFDAPIESRDVVVAAVDERAMSLVDHLAAHGLSMVRLHVSIESDHGERSERIWYRSDGFVARTIIESVRWQLDAWVRHATPTSGVVAVRLSPEHVVVDAGRQASLWGGERDGDRFAVRAVRRVVDLLGEQSVTVPAWRGGRDAAHMFELVRSDAVDLGHRTVEGDTWRGALPAPAPSMVFDTSLRGDVSVRGDAPASGAPLIDLVDRDGRHITVDARHAMSAEPSGVRISGRTYPIVAWAGPWPVEERWWDPRRARRAVRLQLVLRVHESPPSTRAMLAVLERRVWRLAAWYA